MTISVLLLGCTPGTDTGDHSDPGEAPTIHMDEPSSVDAGAVVLSGEVEDAEDPAEVLVVSLDSDPDGRLWKGNPNSDGSWTWEGTLSPGLHTLTATVRDTDGQEGSDVIRWTVLGENHDPTCAIELPEDGASFELGESVPFSGSAEDVDGDDLLLLWSSDVQGALFTGDRFEMILEPGLHTILLEVSDGRAGECEDTVTIQVGD